MGAERYLHFPPFQLDPVNQRLWREGQEIPLRQKTFAVLLYLIERPDQLVTKAALLDAVWPRIYVNDIAPGVCIQELRRALGDERKTPRFIATVHGRGYRFVGQVVSSQHSVASSHSAPPTPNPQHPTPMLVGRDTELSRLHHCLAKALHGERQLVFVSGEPGIGKTALVETFLQSLESSVQRLVSETQDMPFPPARTLDSRPQTLDPSVWLGQGQCIEQHGAGEAFLPILDALGRLCRGVKGEALIGLLRRYAPMWLVQLPAFVDPAEQETLQRKIQGASRARMLRELAEVLEALTLEQPLVLWFEDLHWSDVSTLDFLAFLARRKEPAQLVIIGTYRPVEMLSDGHPLKGILHELYAHQLGRELALRRLTETEVNTYLTLRFPESVLPTRLGTVLQQRTGGNPLFLASLVQDLLTRHMLLQDEDGRWAWQGELAELERWTPESMRHVLARQRERLTQDDQRLLEAASLAGQEFSAATVAAALETEATQIEDHCGRLAEQQQFLRQAGISEWPDGTRAGRYGFLHALYQEFWHERVSIGHQQQWHLRMGERKEAAYGQRAGEIAAELALHFEQGQEYRRAVRYLQLAGESAMRRNAHQEASILLTKGLELLKALPDTPERAQQELPLQLALWQPLQATRGYAAPEVGSTGVRARELCQQLRQSPQLGPALWNLVVFYMIRGELQTARELEEQMLHLPQSPQDLGPLASTHMVLGWTLYWIGELTLARTHLEQALALWDPQKHPHSTVKMNDKVNCLSFAAWTLWHLGYPDQASKRNQEALALAEGLSQPFTLAYALGFAARFHVIRREGQKAREQADATITLSTKQGFPYWLAYGTMMRGGALALQGQREEGITQLRQGQAVYRDLGAKLGLSWSLAMLTEAYGKEARVEEGVAMLAEALEVVHQTGERVGEAELYRLKGELLLAQEGSRLQAVGFREKTEEVETCFLKAIDIARKQQARSLELRAVVSLARLWQTQGKKDEAHKMLAEIYGWFTEGFDTKDLQEAEVLLEELREQRSDRPS